MVEELVAKGARRQKRRRKLSENVNLFIFLLPAMFFVLVFIAFPVLYSGYLSLTEFKFGIDKAPTFIFLQGYIDRLTDDSLFTAALRNQAVFAVSYFSITFLFSLVIAIFINEISFGAQAFQVIFYLPMIIPMSLAGITWAWLLSPVNGFTNTVIRTITDNPRFMFDWYQEPKTALIGLVAARSWKMVGFTLIIFIAGLKGIPGSYREAARVDGANFRQEIWQVILPNLRPYMLISSIWILINSLKVFDLVRVVTEGGPGIRTYTLYYYSWKLAFERQDLGQASQVAYITAAIIIILAVVLNRVFRPETAERG
jgi:ABC-type sugar transport system permease subunit